MQKSISDRLQILYNMLTFDADKLNLKICH